MSIELLTCLLITIGALVYVFYLPGKLYMGPEKTRVIYLRERKEAIYENLRDLNFEFKAGKFPDSDYQTMKTSLEEEAAAVLAEIARLEEAAATAPVRRPKRSQSLKLPQPPSHVRQPKTGIFFSVSAMHAAARFRIRPNPDRHSHERHHQQTRGGRRCRAPQVWAREWKNQAAPRPTPRANSALSLTTPPARI